MHGRTTLALLSAAAIGHVAGEAPPTSGNPPNVAYKATIEKAFFEDAVLPGPLKASIVAQAPADGEGVGFTVHFENLPDEGGPFSKSSPFFAAPHARWTKADPTKPTTCIARLSPRTETAPRR